MDGVFLNIFLENCMQMMKQNREELIRLDSIVGDGDLGLTMSDGFEAAYRAVENTQEDDFGKQLYIAGKAMANKVPSTMGTLMASGFMNAGKRLKGKEAVDESLIDSFLESYGEGVMNRGNAKLGEKTFLDGFLPASQVFKQAVKEGKGFCKSAEKAAKAAEKGYEDTKTMKAIHGRAAIHGENSRGFPDSGAYVAVLIFKALLKTSEQYNLAGYSTLESRKQL